MPVYGLCQQQYNAQFVSSFGQNHSQTGKSTLLRHTFPDYTYVTFDDLIERTHAANDPLGFLKAFGTPVILDEIQYVPELLSWIKLDWPPT